MIGVADVIAERLGFDAFMGHLRQEFSMENLLAVVEMTQYKVRCTQIERAHGTADTPDRVADMSDEILKFPSALPRSDIVYGEYGEYFDVEADEHRIKDLDYIKECE